MTNRDLAIGDRVMLSPNHDYRITKTTPAEYNPIGIKGTVVPYTWGLQEGHWVQVEWDNGLTNHYPITDDYLININKPGNKSNCQVRGETMKTDEELAQEIMELKTHIDKEDFLIYGSNSGEFQNLRRDAKAARISALVDSRSKLVELLNEQYKRTKTF